MIHYTDGNIFESTAQALVNVVNTVGVIGKGMALQFKKAYPNNFNAYQNACKQGDIAIGKLFVTRDRNLSSGEKIIVNFPTKKDWRSSAEYSFVESGLDNLAQIIKEQNIKSIALPQLGVENGGLDWEKVKKIIEQKLNSLDAEIFIYEPAKTTKENTKRERIKLTETRALLLYVLFDLVSKGEDVSEFSSEKICYFLQKFGAEKYFKLHFEPTFCGLYSGKVRYILNYLNGSYITGYSDMNRKSFESLVLISNGYKDVKAYIDNNPELLEIATKTTKFLNGFYSEFTLELLSSIDYIATENNTFDKQIITQKLAEWNDKKRNKFSNQTFIDLAIDHLKKNYMPKSF